MNIIKKNYYCPWADGFLNEIVYTLTKTKIDLGKYIVWLTKTCMPQATYSLQLPVRL